LPRGSRAPSWSISPELFRRSRQKQCLR
jgi:hypothetical protein